MLEAFIDPIGKIGNGYLGEINGWTIFIRMMLVFIFASILGIERSQKRHAAGLRTFIFVGMFAVTAGLVDKYLIDNNNVSFPILSAAVIIGIAIISANTMLYSSKNQIKGLTTAVALLSSTFIGITIGSGFYTIGIIGFVLMIIGLGWLPLIEIYLKNRSNHFEIHLELKNKSNLKEFIETIRKLGLKIDDIETNPAYINSGLSVYTLALTITSKELKKYQTHKEIIEALKSLDYVYCVEEIN